MRAIYFFTLFLFLGVNFLFAQYPIANIPNSIKKDAKAVVRLDDTQVNLKAYNKMEVTRTLIVTILNKEGNSYGFMPMQYDKNTKIREYEGEVLDALGFQIKKFKKKDYVDRSSIGRTTLYADDRVLYYDYTPVTYPYTIKQSYTYETTNTAFIPRWNPVKSFNIGVEQSQYKLINESGIKLKTHKLNVELFKNIEFNQGNNSFEYILKNHEPIEWEVLCPGLDELVPRLMISPFKFEIAGHDGEYNDWNSFGKWMYDDLIDNRQALPEEEKIKVRELLEGIEDKREKIRVLYQYMQEKTRYIFVAIGIGGWQPYPAEYVSSKGYGDCKALSNYMMSLLKEIGIDSNYTVVYGDINSRRDINPDFASFQGNHAILNVPMENDTIWLECTNQQTAFNHLGNFTNDRYALSVSKKGGEIVRTQSYPAEINNQIIQGKGVIDSTGKLTFEYTDTTSGLQYDYNYRVFYQEELNQKNWLKDKLNNIKDLELNTFEFNNDRNTGKFTQKISFTSAQYAKILGGNLIFPVIPVGFFETSLKKDSFRKLPVQVYEGYNDTSDFIIDIPQGYSLNYKLEPIDINTEFGEYHLTFEYKNQALIIHRELKTIRGTFHKEKYMDYVAFRRAIEKADKTKILFEKF